jgi:hypothetical protein
MAGSPSHPPYLKAGSGAANDSGLDLPLEKESSVLASSNTKEVGPHGTNLDDDETVSPVNAEDEVRLIIHTAIEVILTHHRHLMTETQPWVLTRSWPDLNPPLASRSHF